MKQITEKSENGSIKEKLWYLGLIVTLAILFYFWWKYFDISTIIPGFEFLLPKLVLVIIIVLFVNVFLKVTQPILKMTLSHHFKKDDWKLIQMIYIYSVWILAILIILNGYSGTSLRLASP